MMLHTDAFNRNNKNKMTKADYVKNSRLDGVPPLVLEVRGGSLFGVYWFTYHDSSSQIFFDNTCYTPFVYMEDEGFPVAFGHKRDVKATAPGMSMDTRTPLTLRNGKLDIYGMIASASLHTLRVDYEAILPPLEPFCWHGTRPFFDFAQVQHAFIKAPNLMVAEIRPRRRSSAALVATENGMMAGAPGRSQSSGSNLNLKVCKVGLLSRKGEYELLGEKRAIVHVLMVRNSTQTTCWMAARKRQIANGRAGASSLQRPS
jgi:hypothetical protein